MKNHFHVPIELSSLFRFFSFCAHCFRYFFTSTMHKTVFANSHYDEIRNFSSYLYSSTTSYAVTPTPMKNYFTTSSNTACNTAYSSGDLLSYGFELGQDDMCCLKGAYRFGFQGQESENQLYGTGNASFFKYRISDNRIGRFFAVDPLASEYPWNSPYAFSENRLIDAIELEGLEKYEVNQEYPLNSNKNPNTDISLVEAATGSNANVILKSGNLLGYRESIHKFSPKSPTSSSQNTNEQQTFGYGVINQGLVNISNNMISQLSSSVPALINTTISNQQIYANTLIGIGTTTTNTSQPTVEKLWNNVYVNLTQSSSAINTINNIDVSVQSININATAITTNVNQLQQNLSSQGFNVNMNVNPIGSPASTIFIDGTESFSINFILKYNIYSTTNTSFNKTISEPYEK
ncbi:MAG: hypothetical protein PHT69_05255 [Bacteroidales bacterium]|nr:hypothetical protein [Bacteroidales bacterium]